MNVFPASAGVRRAGQLVVRLGFAFAGPKPGDTQALGVWLKSLLAIDVDVPVNTRVVPQTGQGQLALQWLWCCLLLCRELLQAARMPVFDEPEILSLAADPSSSGRWQARVGLALMDGAPRAAYDAALRTSFQLGGWAAAHVMNDDTIDAFFSRIEKRVTAPLSRLISAGSSTLPVLRVAHRRGIAFTHLGGGVYQLGWGSRARRLDRSTTEQDSAMGARLSQNKVLGAHLLRSAGLPAPVHEVPASGEMALPAALRIGWPVVVKPADCERGEGVTVDVADEATLLAAFDAASKLSRSKQVLVERQVAGVCHRLFVFNGKLLYAVKRLPMSVRGDGQRTVAQLIEAEVRLQRCKPHWRRSGVQPLDDLARAAIAAAGHAVSSVPPDGVLVALRRIESTAWGGVDEEVSHGIHPQNLELALRAAALFGLHVAGIDIITPDIGRPWFENGAIINEVNFAPLLGGGEISRRHIPVFLDDLMPDSGCIPVEVFVGGSAALEAARERWRGLLADGLRCYLTTHDTTLAPSGEEWIFPFQGAYRRVRAMVLSSTVDAIVLVVQTDEFVDSGLPLESVDRVVKVDAAVLPCRRQSGPVPALRLQALLALLSGWEGK